VSFQEAVTTVLTKKYADFSGRARRSEYWWWALAAFVAQLVVRLIGAAIGTPILYILLSLAILVPGLAVGVRRLHDTGRSGWWLLIALTVIGVLVLLVFFVQEGEARTNAYGPDPKGAETQAYEGPAAGWGQPQV
jgi:uncharacterized membrane protein YhaH (DUF805 family)